MLIYTHTKAKKRNSKTQKEIAEYEAWLQSVKTMPGVSKRSFGGKTVAPKTSTPTTQSSSLKKATYVTGACTTGGIMKDYHKMSKSDREIVDNLATCVAPLHKSNYVYVSEGMNPASLGRKNEVL